MKQSLLALVAAYKRWISPALPNACRFVPTCSEYAMEAVERHGAFRGSLLAAWRVLRCQPLARSGYDPVPQELGIADCNRFCCHPERGRLPLASESKDPYRCEDVRYT
jgi:hypothetical protein